MTNRSFLAIALFLLTGCPSKTPTRAQQVNSTVEVVDELGLGEMRQNLESSILENYVQLSYGNIEAVADSLSADRTVQLVGVAPNRVIVGVRSKVAGWDRRLFANRNPVLLSKNLDVQLSADGSVGWLYDELSYRVSVGARQASIPVRRTAVFVRNVSRWELVAEHQSFGVDDADIAGMRQDGSLSKAAEFPGRGSAELGEAEVVVRDRIASFVKGEGVLADDGFALYPNPVDWAGSSSKKKVGLGKLGAGLFILSKFRMEFAANRRVAWAIAVLKASGIPDAPALYLRGTFVLERRFDSWEVMQAHISAPVSESYLLPE